MNFKQLLMEEEELDTSEKLRKAVEKGRVPGIKPDTKIIDTVYNGVLFKLKELPSIYKNAAVKLALKRLMIHNQGISDEKAYLAYFKNRNKEEAKTEHKDLISSFENGTISDDDFIKKSLEAFKEKEKSKKLYEDDTWLVVVPKNFTASCKYGANTKWCTTSEEGYKDYTKMGDLVIVINKKKNPENTPSAKVQFHKQTRSIKDAKDFSVNEYEYLLQLPKAVQNILKEYGFTVWNEELKTGIKSKDATIVKNALKNGAYPDSAALILAVEKDEPSIVKMLLDAGSDVHVGNDTPIRNAVKKGNKEIVKLLLDAGADVNIDNEAPLYNAVTENNDVELVKMLLDAGAKVDNGIIVTAQRSVETERKNPEILKLLIKYKEK